MFRLSNYGYDLKVTINSSTMSTILQQYVDNDIFTLRSDDDFSKLKEAANSLSKSEFKKKSKLPSYILTAFDPNINSDDPGLEKTKELVTKQSPTVLSQSGDTPRTILRAVILEALYTKAKNNIEYARILWLTASSVIEHYVTDSEKDILYSILEEFGEAVEREAVEKWSSVNEVNTSTIEKPNISIDEVNDIKVAIDTFKSNFLASVQYNNPNPNHTTHIHNNINTFTSSLRETGVNEIAHLVDKSFSSYKDSIDEISNSLEGFITEIEPYFNEIGNQVVQGVEAVNNRSELLWWKESLYSRSTKSSYRGLDNINFIPVVMAFDLYDMVNQIYPVSIDYFLRETLLKLIPSDHEEISINDFTTLFKEGFLAEYIKTAKIKLEHSENRNTLLTYLNSVAQGHTSNSDIQLGIAPDTKFKLDDLAVWLFHDLQAYKTILN